MRSNTVEFIEKAKKVHGDKYDYVLVNYKNAFIKIKIKCLIHNIIFKQTPNSHLSGHGCPECSKNQKSNTAEFTKKAKKIHGDKYKYSLVDYKGNKLKVRIICPIHGEFLQKPNDHLFGKGCLKCGKEIIRSNTEEFVSKARKIHGNKYGYYKVDYKNNYTNIKIVCLKHGIFEQLPNHHLSKKCGCPKCISSHGENIIRNYLIENNLIFEEQKKFGKCKNVNKLLFDFFLPNHNIIIEYDGKQHYEPVDIFGGIEKFKKVIINDNIKNKFCTDNNIRLIRIKYDENINEVLKNVIMKLVA